MGLLIALTWHVGNAALSPRRIVIESYPLERPVVVAPSEDAIATAAAPTPIGAQQPAAPASDRPIQTARIGGTGGIGAFLRASPRLADRMRAWPDGTVMQLLGEETHAEGRLWLRVTAPDGVDGWIPADYLRR
jgi:hypothetical protein